MSNEKILYGYVRVSTNSQVESGAGLEAQRDQLRLEANRRNMRLVLIEEPEGVSGKSTKRRGELLKALASLDKGEAHALAVSKLDRLARNVADFLAILERSRKGKWALIVLDLNIDTATPMGEAMATISATFAQLERKRIGERTKEALAVKKSQGVKLGAPRKLAEPIRARITNERRSGVSYRRIAQGLTADRVAPARGSAWYASSIRAICNGEGVA
jgi:DNA invertase Pin-like site-specific DNA recombinase